MDFLRQWAVSLIISAAAVTAVIILTPRGSTDKTVKAVASIFVISVIFTPFTQMKIEIPAFEWADYDEEVNTNLNEAVLSVCRNAVEDSLTRRAAELNVALDEICINADINTEGCIIIHEISVTVKGGSCDLQKLSGELSEAAGVQVAVILNE